MFTIHVGDQQPTLYVHEQVMVAFGPPRPFTKAMIRHLNDIRDNNHINNLAWGTQRDNMTDAKRNGRLLGGYRPKGSKGNNMTVPFTWSYSRLRNYETCPKRHYHYDIAKDVVEPESGAMAEGHAVHKALELRVTRKQSLPLGMKQYEPLMVQLTGLPGAIHAEQKLALTRDFEPIGFFGKGVWFRTVLDFCVVKDKDAVVVDYKTGRPQEDTTQLQLMSATIMHHMPEVDRVRAVLMFINYDRNERALYQRDDLSKIWGGVLPRVRQVQQAVQDQEYPPKPNGLCKRYCAVVSCPYHGVGTQG